MNLLLLVRSNTGLISSCRTVADFLLQPGERCDQSLQRKALLLSLLGWSNQDMFDTDIGQFSPVFDSKDQPALIWFEVSHLRRHYSGRITMPFVHDTQTSRLYPAEGGCDRWEV